MSLRDPLSFPVVPNARGQLFGMILLIIWLKVVSAGCKNIAAANPSNRPEPWSIKVRMPFDTANQLSNWYARPVSHFYTTNVVIRHRTLYINVLAQISQFTSLTSMSRVALNGIRPRPEYNPRGCSCIAMPLELSRRIASNIQGARRLEHRLNS